MRSSHLPRETKAHLHVQFSKRSLINIAAIGLLVYIMVPQVGGLTRSFNILSSANKAYVLVALVSVVLTYVVAAYTYCLLSARPLPYVSTLLVQVSTGFLNRLLPIGLGGLSINVLYLKKRGHDLSAATAIAVLNNFLGFMGNALLVVGVVIFSPDHLPSLTLPRPSPAIATLVTVLIVMCLVILLERQSLQKRVQKFLAEIRRYLGLTLMRRKQNTQAVLSSMTLTALYAAVLLYVLLALNIDFSWLQASLVVSLGSVLGALLPTPGGLGGTEAGLLAGLTAYNVPAELAVAAVLMYRGLTYWLPLIPGYIAFRVVQSRYV